MKLKKHFFTERQPSNGGAIFKTFKARAKDLGESVDEPEPEMPDKTGPENESPSKIILGTSNKNFIAEEKTFMGLNLKTRKASMPMPVFQVLSLII
jgi:hypothetical protein